MIRRCTICKNNPYFTFAHISSHAHKHNINKLPMNPPYWKMRDEDIYDFLHSNKKNQVAPLKLKHY